MREILILANQTDKHLGLFNDLESDTRVILHYIIKKKVGFIIKILRHIHLSRRLDWFDHIFPFRYVWYDNGNKICLNNIKLVLVINSSLEKVDLNYLRKCKVKGIDVVLLILDSINADSITVHRNKHLYFSSLWDKVITYDPVDAIKYGFIYKGYCYYSKNNSVPMRVAPQSDIYFAGNTKGGRSNLINDSFLYFTTNGCKCIYDVQLKCKKEERCNGINYVQKWLKYEDVLFRMSDCKCILEIVQNNQNGPSLRYFEAIFYNKKLITNNKNIVGYPYYNKKWMRIIENPEEIDTDWVKSKEVVNYQYKGDFSPIHFIDYLLENE